MERALHEVAPGVYVATSRRCMTTTTVVVVDGAALLVDPAWDPDELDALAATLQGRGWRVDVGLATHAHHDHLLWHPEFGDAPRYASAGTVALARQNAVELLDALGHEWPERLRSGVGAVDVAPQELTFGGAPVELVVHDGHVPGHTAVWLEAQRVLLAGDMLSDVELPLPFEPDDLPAYLAGLETLAPYVRACDVLIPGHGTPTAAAVARLDADRMYLQALLAGGDPPDSRRHDPSMSEVHERLRSMCSHA